VQAEAECIPPSLIELARVLVRLDHVARFIVNANHSVPVNRCETFPRQNELAVMLEYQVAVCVPSNFVGLDG